MFELMLTAKVFTGDKVRTEKNFQLIRYPVGVSTKWDGWRMTEIGGEATCRSLKPPKNRYVQRVLRDFYRAANDRGMVTGLDGEIMCGDIYSPNVMQQTTSGVGSYEGEPDFTYQLFDAYGGMAERPFRQRLDTVQTVVEQLRGEFPFLAFTEHKLVTNREQLMLELDSVISTGGEGVIGRRMDAPYKFGRPSMREGTSWALKPTVDDECVILRVKEQLHNANVATKNERGHTTRSSHKENLSGKGTFGAADCWSPKFKEVFSIGMGFGLTDKLRAEIWAVPEKFVGHPMKFSHLEIGAKDRPRQPKWGPLRSWDDIPADSPLRNYPR